MPDLWVDETVPCYDPECAQDGGRAEPETDGDHRYFACTSCGYEFGYALVQQPEGSCAIGAGEETRRRFSQPAAGPGAPVLLQIGRRPE